MRSASPLHHILAAMADDPYWAATTRRGAPETADRTATRTTTPAPANLTWLAIQQDHDRNLRDFVDQHGTPDRQPAGDLYAAAGIIAHADQQAAGELAALDLADRLRAAIAIGEGLAAVGAITCPHCACYSLIPVTGWRATCARRHCSTPQGPRTWSLRAIADHHLRATRAA